MAKSYTITNRIITKLYYKEKTKKICLVLYKIKI